MNVKNDAIFDKLFGKQKQPDFWEIRNSFIEYAEYESDVLKLHDFSKDLFAGVFIGYNPNTRDRKPESFLSAGINHFGDTPEEGCLAAVALSAYWSTYPGSEFVDSHYLPLEPHRQEIENVFGFKDKLVFRPGNSIYRIGVVKLGVDLTDKENIHSHFKWLRQNLERMYWLIHLHEKGVLFTDE